MELKHSSLCGLLSPSAETFTDNFFDLMELFRVGGKISRDDYILYGMSQKANPLSSFLNCRVVNASNRSSTSFFSFRPSANCNPFCLRVSSNYQGDFVDRGFNSLETFTMLMVLKARYEQTPGGVLGCHHDSMATLQ